MIEGFWGEKKNRDAVLLACIVLTFVAFLLMAGYYMKVGGNACYYCLKDGAHLLIPNLSAGG